MPASTVTGATGGTRPAANAAVVALFAVATCLNAALLFAVQPMFTKMVLPLLGGTPSVWNTCLLFFQGALLLGYLYAHLTSRWLTPARQALLHLALLLLALLFLPITVAGDASPPPGSSLPIGWLLALLTTSLGLPFLLLSAGAPMLQRWFATTRHPSASNPYFLYVASNLGSFAALIAYPAIVEPEFSLSDQRINWMEGYYALVTLLAVAAVVAWRWRRRDDGRVERVRAGKGEGANVAVGGGPPAAASDSPAESPPPDTPSAPTIVPTRAWRLRWLLLSFAPSSLLIGVTTFLSTDIASVPFLWVVPLALYLLTFVIVFAQRPILGRRFMLGFQLLVIAVLMVVMAIRPDGRVTQIGILHLVAFFATAMVCHRELADSRPRAEFLTEFYLWMSLGGVLGGVFNVILAPMLYDRVLEYPYAIIIALGLRPGMPGAPYDRRAVLLDLLLPAALFAAVMGGFRLPSPPDEWGKYASLVFVAAAMFVAILWLRRPLRLALGVAAVFFAVDIGIGADDDTFLRTRSFFGVYRVRGWNEYTILQHGTTTHGGQSRRPERRREPLTYYHREGPLGDIFARTTDPARPRAVALVGLGTGTTACYARPGERWSYFEIDPVIVRVARSPALFTYLRDCQPEVRVVLGDARLRIAEEPDSSYDLIVLDAFSSDAIPVHLMTREALALYLRKLRPRGVIAFHISNRYLDLRSVVVELARDARLAGALVDRNITAAQRQKLYYGSRWVALAREASTLAPLVKEAGWEVLAPAANTRLWTDDYSDVLGVMRWRR